MENRLTKDHHDIEVFANEKAPKSASVYADDDVAIFLTS